MFSNVLFHPPIPTLNRYLRWCSSRTNDEWERTGETFRKDCVTVMLLPMSVSHCLNPVDSSTERAKTQYGWVVSCRHKFSHGPVHCFHPLLHTITLRVVHGV
jgi:hypothetical protein